MLVVKRTRSKIKVWAFGLLLFALVFSMAFIIWAYIYFRGLDQISECYEDVQHDYPSPGGGGHALVVIKNCGATVSTVSQVYLSDAGSISKAKGDVSASVIFSTTNLSGVSISWLGENNLEIRSADANNKSFKYRWLDKLIDVQIIAN